MTILIAREEGQPSHSTLSKAGGSVLKINNGLVYLAGIIGWHILLSWKFAANARGRPTQGGRKGLPL